MVSLFFDSFVSINALLFIEVGVDVVVVVVVVVVDYSSIIIHHHQSS